MEAVFARNGVPHPETMAHDFVRVRRESTPVEGIVETSDGPPARFVIRSPLGYYAGRSGSTRRGHVAAPKWLPSPSPYWLFGSVEAAEQRIRERGFTDATVEPWANPTR